MTRWLVVAGLVVFLLFTFGVGYGASRFRLQSAERSTIVPCVDEATRKRIEAIIIEALDEALKDHIVKTFGVWLRDETDQPRRARTGIHQGVGAYVRSREGITKAWDFPPC